MVSRWVLVALVCCVALSHTNLCFGEEVVDYEVSDDRADYDENEGLAPNDAIPRQRYTGADTQEQGATEQDHADVDDVNNNIVGGAEAERFEEIVAGPAPATQAGGSGAAPGPAPAPAPAAEAPCTFTFFPDQVRSPLGNLQMALNRISNVTLQQADNPIESRDQYAYEFSGRLMKTINPRLCRFVVTLNNVPTLNFDATDFERKPLTKESNLPEVRCMLNPTEMGPPIVYYPRFSRAGALTPRDSQSATFPLCGDLFYFRKNQLLHWTGVVDYGIIQILECQSGEPQHAHNWHMVPIFQANCTGPPREPTFPEGGFPPGQEPKDAKWSSFDQNRRFG